MGDHRINLSIRAEFHGKVYEIKDAWWNWCGPVDQRVIDFFTHMDEDGKRRYYEALDDAYDARNEQEERKELQRLKEKYEKQGDKT